MARPLIAAPALVVCFVTTAVAAGGVVAQQVEPRLQSAHIPIVSAPEWVAGSEPQRAAASVAPSAPVGMVACRLSWQDMTLSPIIAVVAFAAPVAGIAWLVADDGKEAAVGAVAGGAVYALGATAVRALWPSCSSTDPLIYIWTPLAAIAGAVVATR